MAKLFNEEVRAFQYLKHFNLHPNHFILPHITHTDHLFNNSCEPNEELITKQINFKTKPIGLQMTFEVN